MKSLVFLMVVLGFETVMACSCGSWSSFYILANQPGAVVAKVKTLSEIQPGAVKVSVRDVLTGTLRSNQVDLYGQDGLNCAGPVIADLDKEWVVVFSKAEDWDGNQKYFVGGCGDSTFLFDTNETTEALVGESRVNLSFSEFKALAKQEVRPSVKGLDCTESIRREFHDNQNFEVNTEFSQSWSGQHKFDDNGYLTYDNEKKFSYEGKEKQYSVSLFSYMIARGIYTVEYTVRDPWSNTSFESTSTLSPFLNSFTPGADISRRTYIDPAQPENRSHHRSSTRVHCKLDVSMPLVPNL